MATPLPHADALAEALQELQAELAASAASLSEAGQAVQDALSRAEDAEQRCACVTRERDALSSALSAFEGAVSALVEGAAACVALKGASAAGAELRAALGAAQEEVAALRAESASALVNAKRQAEHDKQAVAKSGAEAVTALETRLKTVQGELEAVQAKALEAGRVRELLEAEVARRGGAAAPAAGGAGGAAALKTKLLAARQENDTLRKENERLRNEMR